MKIIGFVWYNEIVRKIEQKHDVQQNEVREVFAKHPRFRFVEKGHKPDENVYAALGRTRSGRYLIIFFIYKNDKFALILSARDMTHEERRKYEQK